MGRGRKSGWRGRILAAAMLLAMVGAGWGWWEAGRWMPSREEFPAQGALIGEQDGPVDFTVLSATGAQFVYLEASRGDDGRDARFSGHLASLEGGKLAHGAVHYFDPCVPAEDQAANFVTIVPRDAAMLPPAIALDTLASTCGDPVIEAAVESELTTFINQVETHTGQPVVLKLSPEFEAAYGIASRIERNLWLEQDWIQPDYGGRPWALWTANSALRSDVSSARLRWVVVQP